MRFVFLKSSKDLLFLPIFIILLLVVGCSPSADELLNQMDTIVSNLEKLSSDAMNKDNLTKEEEQTLIEEVQKAVKEIDSLSTILAKEYNYQSGKQLNRDQGRKEDELIKRLKELGDRDMKWGNQVLNEWNNNITIPNPNDTIAYIKRGIYRGNCKYFEGAIRDFEMALKLDPKCAEAYYWQGNAHHALKEDWKFDLDKAIQFEPDNAKYYSMRGCFKLEGPRSRYEYKDPDYIGAKEDFNKVIELGTKDPVTLSYAYYNRGLCNVQLVGRERDAYNDFKKAEELGFKDAEAMIDKYCSSFRY